jgi:co-chaperonin GroES (HSP10)
MSTENFEYEATQSMEDAFPSVKPDVAPLGGRVLVQLRRTAKKTKSGLVIVEETAQTVKWNQQVAKVVALGPLAFKNRETLEPWREGAWVNEGDFVRVPRWNGDRIEVRVKDSEDPVVFVVFNDHELICKVTGDPLQQKTYIL